MRATVTKQGKDLMLHFSVTDSCSHTGGDLEMQTHVQTTEMHGPVVLGKATKLELPTTPTATAPRGSRSR